MTTSAMRLRASKLQDAGNGFILGWVGTQSTGLMMRQWWIDRCPPDHFPTLQLSDENWSRLIVVNAKERTIVTYEQCPVAIPILEPFMAWGSGRDFAMGAMATGATAREAVEIACRFSVDCGIDIEEYSIENYFSQ